MLGRSSGNHDWLLANASACVSCSFRLRNASDCVWMDYRRRQWLLLNAIEWPTRVMYSAECSASSHITIVDWNKFAKHDIGKEQKLKLKLITGIDVRMEFPQCSFIIIIMTVPANIRINPDRLAGLEWIFKSVPTGFSWKCPSVFRGDRASHNGALEIYLPLQCRHILVQISTKSTLMLFWPYKWPRFVLKQKQLQPAKIFSH